ncbi:LysE family translocator [Vibrio panuliri]|uniref:Transporter n=1 Tax=Vibrio panuliri TaxID=1381081 RepID=A0ABX3FK26_9VIBR|nr:LysE family translocator [Vibrio panuliri]KAB1457851.1 LysE family translocator [Vibrio panuliri]OLQ94520.1 transporter [Vibrio panuliri]
MTVSLLFAMMIFAIVGATTPGPVNLIATSTAVHQGMRASLKFVLGASLAYALVVFLSGLLMQNIMTTLPKIEIAMQVAGSFLILYLAFKILTAPISPINAQINTMASFWTGVITQLINPKAWLVALSGISLYVIGYQNQAWLLTSFTAISLISCLLGVGTWAVLGHLLTSYLQNSTNQLQFNRVMAGLLAISVCMIWL